jgi:hypothetical protein
MRLWQFRGPSGLPGIQRVGWVERSETHGPKRTMTAYRRNLLAGGTYFFTLNLADRRSSLLTDNI